MPSRQQTADRTLDTLGTYCPIPVLRTARVMAAMSDGQILEVLADDRGILADLPDWCLGHGHEYLGHRVEGRNYRLYVRKV